jgi:GxxExxY protein
MDSKDDKVIFKKESYEIVGCCFEAYNQLGSGHREKTYQGTLENLFTSNNIPFASQYYIPIKIDDEVVDKHFFDFLIDNKIILEIKTGNHFHKRDLEQLHSYLKSARVKLGILVNFSSNGVHFRRVLN